MRQRSGRAETSQRCLRSVKVSDTRLTSGPVLTHVCLITAAVSHPREAPPGLSQDSGSHRSPGTAEEPLSDIPRQTDEPCTSDHALLINTHDLRNHSCLELKRRTYTLNLCVQQ
ncbi:phospholipid phosphatase-related type 5-like protein [Labeo rohita]|uniref:Phospholipid phosphatase-related type 5-like protein n=1 Tax=Labeo rohita TaxID=84645 RepID=A0A498P1Z4_LABRO|nr:phospholipid phosphatase-related type 5-like protein [Labeo rohita]